MDEKIERVIRHTKTLKDLNQFEENAQKRNNLTPEIKDAITARMVELGKAEIAQRTGFDLENLSPAEEKIVKAASLYLALKKKKGTDAGYTIRQMKKQGFLDAAEISVSKRNPTQGYQELENADLSDLSYEQIVIDHPEEFSPRAMWFARRTLNLPNDSEKPPVRSLTPVQSRTETLLEWLRERSVSNGGLIRPFSNAEAAAVLGMDDMHRYGRVFGNIQSRIDFACYMSGLPPLGLTADSPFDKAWNQGDRDWGFPIEKMQASAQSKTWRRKDFERILRETEKLPGQAHIPWLNELTTNEVGIKTWAYGLEPFAAEENILEDETEPVTKRNPLWSRDELILALDLYVRFQSNPPETEIAELSELLQKIARVRKLAVGPTYRNANGVRMKLSNFRRLDPVYIADGKVGLSQGSDEEKVIWNEYADNVVALRAAATAIRAAHDVPQNEMQNEQDLHIVSSTDVPYWAFVCNPKKWAIDKFLEKNIKHDSWGIRPSDRYKFAPGQLGIVRVGVDQRTKAELDGRERLESGIYALVEVESHAYEGTGAGDEFWTPGEQHEPGRPTVRIRYLRTYQENPLTIERLREERPEMSPHILNSLQASCFPISAQDFHEIMGLLGEDLDNLPLDFEKSDITTDILAKLEKKYKNAAPEVKSNLSKRIERGPIGAQVKRAIGHKCQLCEALGRNPVGFLKPSGEPYVEAHHVMPVSERQVGSLSASNIMIVCANHHRQIHYGGIKVNITDNSFELDIDDRSVSLPRFSSRN
jgi:predicted HNH restriction endonuclease